MKVSVAVVTYNHHKFIAQCLDSILMQETDFEFDIVVGDDVSTDGTRAIVQQYADNHPGRIKAVFPEKNLGDAGRPMFVETTKHCRGQYIAMIDGDDYWTDPRKLQKQSDYLDKNTECSLCYHDVILVFDGEKSPNLLIMPPNHPEFISGEDIIWSCYIQGCSSMARREVVQDFPQWFFDTPWADVPLYLMAAEQGLLGYINEPMGAYRVHETGVWQSLDKLSQIRSAIAVLDALNKTFRKKYGRVIRESLSFQYVDLSKHFVRDGRPVEAIRNFAHAIYLDPLLRRSAYASLLKPILGKIAPKQFR